MGFVYQKLPENHRRARISGFPAKAWVVVSRTAAKAVGIYVGRRRWVTRHAKKVTWGGLWARVRIAVGIGRVRRKPVSYDSVSYARNFDDGVWKEEEEFFRRSGSFACRFGHNGGMVS